MRKFWRWFPFMMVYLLHGVDVAAQTINPDKVVPSFVYHRFGDDRYPSTNISTFNFEAHLKFLSKQGFRSLTVSEATAYLKSPGPVEKVVCLTVDDGFQSFMDNGFPLLQKYGLTATLFINTASVGLNDYLDWDALDSLQKAGIEIGNHSHSHDYFVNDQSRVRQFNFAADINKSQQLMDSLLHRPAKVFAYPYGEFDDDLKRAVTDAGFTAAVAQSSGIMHPEADFFQLPRFPMSDRYGKIASFINKLTMSPIKVFKVETIDYGYNGSPDNPRLIIHFPQEDLNMRGVQSFAQGEPCTKSIRIDKDGNAQLTIKSKKALTSRRTLYTITVPDNDGNWHWFSYTWVRKDVK